MHLMKLLIFQIILVVLFFHPAKSQSQGEWQVLFNGKDFSGWRELNGKHKWEVRDGAIVGTDLHGQPNGFMCTEQEFEDFILELEVSIDTLMNNSGIQFRSISRADYLDGRVHGYQMEIDPKPQKWSGSIYEEGGTRHWLYTTELNPAAKKAFKNNRWNKYRIECIGNTIRTWVNGVPVAHLIDDRFPKGFIGLQLHANNPDDPPGGNEVRFKNIRIKTRNLKPSPPDHIFVVNKIPNYLSPQEKANGFAMLWDGKTVNAGMQGPPIITEKQFGAFILKFEFRLTKGARSGVRYLADREDSTRLSKALKYQIVDDSAAGIHGNLVLGSLAGLKARSASLSKFYYQKKMGDWNEGMIKVLTDGKIEHWLNGFKILEFDRGSSEFADWVSQSEYKDVPGFGKAVEGHILLERGYGEVQFRNVKIKTLDTAERR